jgi:uncharacterized protein YjbI with pentapeptide repeats
MKNQVIAATTFLATMAMMFKSVYGANPEEFRQLLASKSCQACDLSGAGLVMANLTGANLTGANLTGANLSRANLTGADLRGANLTGASLFGANLSNAKLDGANLAGTDLRNAYLYNAQLTNSGINGANLQGAVGIPSQIATPEEFYAWGVNAADKGNHQQAIDYFNQAIALKPDYAGAYLARGITRYQIFDRSGAFQDAQTAEKLFTSQNNDNGKLTTQAFMMELKAPQEGKVSAGKPSFFDFFSGVASVLLQFLPF